MSKQRLYKPRVKYKIHSAKWWNQKYKIYESKFNNIRQRTGDYQTTLLTKKEFKNTWKNASQFNKGENKAITIAKSQLYATDIKVARAFRKAISGLYGKSNKVISSGATIGGDYVSDDDTISIPDKEPSLWELMSRSTTEFASMYSSVLNNEYHRLRAQGMSSQQAKSTISHDYFGSDGDNKKGSAK